MRRQIDAFEQEITEMKAKWEWHLIISAVILAIALVTILYLMPLGAMAPPR